MYKVNEDFLKGYKDDQQEGVIKLYDKIDELLQFEDKEYYVVERLNNRLFFELGYEI